MTRTMPLGAEPVRNTSGVDFRVWAPRRARVRVSLEGGPGAGQVVPLEAEEDGYFSVRVAAAADSTLYRFRLDEDERLFADPASRFQPEGPEGPSQVVDPEPFRWTDAAWRGVPPAERVLYEIHVGAFTREGTWAAASGELERLRDLGVTLVQVMPVADYAGRFGWGYDGVCLYAPTRNYGTPDDFRGFVDRAHGLGLGVLLDVVYNHLGPKGNVLPEFSEDYFARENATEWGDSLNFFGKQSAHVRSFFVENAAYWVREFHLDGLRLDATQSMHDHSREHVLVEIVKRARAAAPRREVFIVAENEPQDVRLVRPPESGGYGIDALCSDDFHHAARVALTGRSEGYTNDYRGSAQELVSAVKWGFLYQGQRSSWQKQPRGTPVLGEPGTSFVFYLQNHDQVANGSRGTRLHALTTPGRFRAATALLLLSPQTPLLFMGQEFGASTPFLYFADHDGELGQMVRDGRRAFMTQFRSLACEEMTSVFPDPAAPETFARAKLDPAESGREDDLLRLHRDLLRLRREDPVFRARRSDRIHGAVLAEECFVLRFMGESGDDRLLLVNLGRDRLLEPLPEPLLAPPAGHGWRVLWSSEDPRYGGDGTVDPVRRDPQTEHGQARAFEQSTAESFRIPGHAALVLAPAAAVARDREGAAQAPSGAERGERP